MTREPILCEVCVLEGVPPIPFRSKRALESHERIRHKAVRIVEETPQGDRIVLPVGKVRCVCGDDIDPRGMSSHRRYRCPGVVRPVRLGPAAAFAALVHADQARFSAPAGERRRRDREAAGARQAFDESLLLSGLGAPR